jgi:hypothetical protein
MDAVEVQDVGLTAEYHPVIGDPVSDPSQAPEVAAPEAPAEVVAPEPQYIDVPDEYGNPYTRVAVDKVPDVIRNKDAYIRQLHERIASQQQAPQQPQQPVVQDERELELRTMQIRQKLVAGGYEDNPAVARFQAEMALDAEKAAKEAAKQTFVQMTQEQHEQTRIQSARAEYEAECRVMPELSGYNVPGTLAHHVYHTHRPSDTTSFKALVSYYKSQGQAPAPAPSALPPNVQQMFQQPGVRPGVARPPQTAAAPQRVGSDPPHVAKAIRDTLSFLGVPPDSPRGQQAIANIRSSAGGA